jgi:hypothetical protein
MSITVTTYDGIYSIFDECDGAAEYKEVPAKNLAVELQEEGVWISAGGRHHTFI